MALRATAPAGTAVAGFDRADGDLAAQGLFAEWLERHPDVDAVIHAASYTAVDAAESDVEGATRDNVDATATVANACAARGLPLLLVSSNYVFSGEQERPYREEDLIGPRGVYARTKWESEEMARRCHPSPTIVRTAWLYGEGKRDFVDAILEQARAGNALRVVDDQRGHLRRRDDLVRLRAGGP